jgi:hypothetical protein
MDQWAVLITLDGILPRNRRLRGTYPQQLQSTVDQRNNKGREKVFRYWNTIRRHVYDISVLYESTTAIIVETVDHHR